MPFETETKELLFIVREFHNLTDSFPTFIRYMIQPSNQSTLGLPLIIQIKSQNAMDSFEDIDFSEIISIIALGAVHEAKRSRKPKTTGLPGAEYLRELLGCGNEKRIYVRGLTDAERYV